MKLLWTGSVTSSSRTDRQTGQPIVYRLTVYDDGQASCSCPSFLFQGVRSPLTRASDRLTYKCKHLLPLFPGGVFRAPDQGSLVEAPGTSPGSPPVDSPGPEYPGADDFPDDDFDQLQPLGAKILRRPP